MKKDITVVDKTEEGTGLYILEISCARFELWRAGKIQISYYKIN